MVFVVVVVVIVVVVLIINGGFAMNYRLLFSVNTGFVHPFSTHSSVETLCSYVTDHRDYVTGSCNGIVLDLYASLVIYISNKKGFS